MGFGDLGLERTDLSGEFLQGRRDRILFLGQAFDALVAGGDFLLGLLGGAPVVGVQFGEFGGDEGEFVGEECGFGNLAGEVGFEG